ncbi:MAG: GatB/YqeY domain-containing protein [Pseudomonadota bacterium]
MTADMKTALKAGDKDRLKVLRLLLADIKRVEVDTRKDLDEAALLAIIEKAVKQRRDSIEQFEKGGRDDLAATEKAELEVISTYLPEQLSDAELDALVADTIVATGADSIRDMGKVMAAIKSKAAGKADMGAVSALVKAKLA